MPPLDQLYIEKIRPHWPATARLRGKWYLILNRDEWIIDNLEDLERRLYDFACDEGYRDDD